MTPDEIAKINNSQTRISIRFLKQEADRLYYEQMNSVKSDKTKKTRKRIIKDIDCRHNELLKFIYSVNEECDKKIKKFESKLVIISKTPEEMLKGL